MVHRIDVIPHVGQPLDHCLGLLYVTRDAAHGKAREHLRTSAITTSPPRWRWTWRTSSKDAEFREVLQILVEAEPPSSRRAPAPQRRIHPGRPAAGGGDALQPGQVSGVGEIRNLRPVRSHERSRLDHGGA